MDFDSNQEYFIIIAEAFESIRIAIAEHATIKGREPILALAADAQLELTEMFDNFRELLSACQAIPNIYNDKNEIFNDATNLEQLVGAIGFHALRANLVLIYLSALANPALDRNNVLHPQNPKFHKVFNLFKKILANPVLDREHRQLEKFIQANLMNIDNIDWSKIQP